MGKFLTENQKGKHFLTRWSKQLV